MRNRAWRRYQRQRMQRHAQYILYHRLSFDKEDALHYAPYWRDNLKKCSCWMCGNPRRNGWDREARYTMQERRVVDAFSDGLEELITDSSPTWS